MCSVGPAQALSFAVTPYVQYMNVNVNKLRTLAKKAFGRKP